MFHYVVKMSARSLHVLDVIVKCQKYVLMYKIGADAQTLPKPFMEVIGEVCQVHSDFEELEHVIWTWAYELQVSGLDEGAAVTAKTIYERFLALLENDYGDLSAKHAKVPDADTFQAFQRETLAIFKAAPLMDFEADAQARKLFSPATKLAN